MTGNNLEDHPALPISYEAREPPFQRGDLHGPDRQSGVEPFRFRPRHTPAWDIASLGE